MKKIVNRIGPAQENSEDRNKDTLFFFSGHYYSKNGKTVGFTGSILEKGSRELAKSQINKCVVRMFDYNGGYALDDFKVMSNTFLGSELKDAIVFSNGYRSFCRILLRNQDDFGESVRLDQSPYTYVKRDELIRQKAWNGVHIWSVSGTYRIGSTGKKPYAYFDRPYRAYFRAKTYWEAHEMLKNAIYALPDFKGIFTGDPELHDPAYNDRIREEDIGKILPIGVYEVRYNIGEGPAFEKKPDEPEPEQKKLESGQGASKKRGYALVCDIDGIGQVKTPYGSLNEAYTAMMQQLFAKTQYSLTSGGCPAAFGKNLDPAGMTCSSGGFKWRIERLEQD